MPSFQSQWLLDGDHLAPEPIPVGEKQYLVYGNLVCTGDEDAFLATTYWVDVTEYAGIADRFHTTRPVVGILQVDNYEDLIRGLEEGERSAIRTEINHRLVQWLEPSGAILLRYERDPLPPDLGDWPLPGLLPEKVPHSWMRSARCRAPTAWRPPSPWALAAGANPAGAALLCLSGPGHGPQPGGRPRPW